MEILDELLYVEHICVHQNIWCVGLRPVKAGWSVMSVCKWWQSFGVWQEHLRWSRLRRTGDEQHSVILPGNYPSSFPLQSPEINNTELVWLIAGMMGKQHANHRVFGSVSPKSRSSDEHGPRITGKKRSRAVQVCPSLSLMPIRERERETITKTLSSQQSTEKL